MLNNDDYDHNLEIRIIECVYDMNCEIITLL